MVAMAVTVRKDEGVEETREGTELPMKMRRLDVAICRVPLKMQCFAVSTVLFPITVPVQRPAMKSPLAI